MKEAERRQLSADELEKPAKTLADHFIQRWDLFPLQTTNAQYVCVHKQLNLNKVCSHLRGDITLGTYILNQESQARFAVLDFDNVGGWNSLLDLTLRLNRDHIPVYGEQSRRCGHLWFFFDQPVTGREARTFAQRVQHTYHMPECEVFPKQDKLQDGPGSLIRLPFGIHRLTGQRYSFFGTDGKPLGATVRAQIAALDTIQCIPRDVFKKFSGERETPRHVIKPFPPKQSKENEHLLSERIKATKTAFEFISEFVDLRPTANGAIGMCPFHEDSHPSFGVNIKENYWHCFAGCGGGSVIDFWSKWREKQGQDASFVATITDLAKLLL